MNHEGYLLTNRGFRQYFNRRMAANAVARFKIMI